AKQESEDDEQAANGPDQNLLERALVARAVSKPTYCNAKARCKHAEPCRLSYEPTRLTLRGWGGGWFRHPPSYQRGKVRPATRAGFQKLNFVARDSAVAHRACDRIHSHESSSSRHARIGFASLAFASSLPPCWTVPESAILEPVLNAWATLFGRKS